jgi:hypothetical protein
VPRVRYFRPRAVDARFPKHGVGSTEPVALLSYVHSFGAIGSGRGARLAAELSKISPLGSGFQSAAFRKSEGRSCVDGGRLGRSVVLSLDAADVEIVKTSLLRA